MWINITTGKVCLTLSDIRQDAPNTSFPQDLTDAIILGAGYAPITKISWGFNPLTERAVELAPIEIDGVWTQQWETLALTTEDIEAKRVAAVPVTVSPRQIRQALARAGLRIGVEAAVAAGDQDTKDWYEFATEFVRTSPIVGALGTALGVTTKQLDDLWTLAGSL